MDTLDLYLYDYIGTWDDEVSSKRVVQELMAHAQAEKIRVFVNSAGGDVYEGLAIHNALARHGAEIEVLVEGVAASIASCIVQAGDVRVIAPTAAMMIHEPKGGTWGDVDDAETLARQLITARQTLAQLYAERSGQGTLEDWLAAMKLETWYDAQEAVAAGLCDTVALGPALTPVVVARRPRAAADRPTARFGLTLPPRRAMLVNTIDRDVRSASPTTMTLAERIKNALGLKAEATDEEVVAAAEAAAAEAPETTETVETTETGTIKAPTAPAPQAVVDGEEAPAWAKSLLASNSTLQARLDARDAADRTALVAAAVADFRIQASETADWERRLKADFAAESKALAGLPVRGKNPSASAPRAPGSSEPGAGGKPATRAEIRAAAVERARRDA